MSNNEYFRKEGLLHVLPQSAHQDEAYLIGNKEGLTRLRDAIDKALKSPGKPIISSSMSIDGEGYWAIALCVTEDQMEHIPLGYTEDYARDDRKIPDWVYRDIRVRNKK